MVYILFPLPESNQVFFDRVRTRASEYEVATRPSKGYNSEEPPRADVNFIGWKSDRRALLVHLLHTALVMTGFF